MIRLSEPILDFIDCDIIKNWHADGKRFLVYFG